MLNFKWHLGEADTATLREKRQGIESKEDGAEDSHCIVLSTKDTTDMSLSLSVMTHQPKIVS